MTRGFTRVEAAFDCDFRGNCTFWLSSPLETDEVYLLLGSTEQSKLKFYGK